MKTNNQNLYLAIKPSLLASNSSDYIDEAQREELLIKSHIHPQNEFGGALISTVDGQKKVFLDFLN